MLPASEIFLDLILPALIVAGVLAIAWLVPSLFLRAPRWRDGRWAGAAAVGAGFAAAECAIGGAPRWPPGSGDAGYWLVWFTVPVAGLGLLDALLRPPDWLRAAVLLAAVELGLRALLAPIAAGVDPPGAWATKLWLVAFGVALVLWWLALERLAARTHRCVTPTVLALVLAAAAAVFGLCGDLKPSLAAAALALMAGATALLARLVRNLSVTRGALLGFVVPLFGLAAFTHFYYETEPPAVAWGWLFVAPLLAWVVETPVFKRHGEAVAGRRFSFALRIALRAVLRLAPVALAAWLAVAAAYRHSLRVPGVQRLPAAGAEDL